MDDGQHERLLDVLEAHRGPVLLSGYDSPLYSRRLQGWKRAEAVSYSQVGSKKKEVLWMNFEPDGQMELEID